MPILILSIYICEGISDLRIYVAVTSLYSRDRGVTVRFGGHEKEMKRRRKEKSELIEGIVTFVTRKVIGRMTASIDKSG